jgi:hypothetical protein
MLIGRPILGHGKEYSKGPKLPRIEGIVGRSQQELTPNRCLNAESYPRKINTCSCVIHMQTGKLNIHSLLCTVLQHLATMAELAWTHGSQRRRSHHSTALRRSLHMSPGSSGRIIQPTSIGDGAIKHASAAVRLRRRARASVTSVSTRQAPR